MKFDETLYEVLLNKEKQENKMKDYIRLCLKNGICPDCGIRLIRQQHSDSYTCHVCGYSNL